jgi:hypothetical protein
MHGQAPRVSHFRAFGCQCFILNNGRLDKFESGSSNGIFWVMLVILEHFVLNLDTNLVMETCKVTIDETQPCNSSVFECAGDDEVGKKIFEDEEDDAGEDDGMMVKLQPRMYPLLPLRRLRCRMVHPLHCLRFSKLKWKQLLRGRSSLGERHRGTCKLIIHPQESLATSMSIRHGRGLDILLTLPIKLLLLLLSRKTLDTLYLILIG